MLIRELILTNTVITDLGAAPLSIEEISQLPALTLAYIGDTICDLYVRTHLVLTQPGDVGMLHKKSAALVNARSQAALARELMPELSGLEKDIFMRGRNAKTNTVPKNMSVADYHYATALEALIGFLYLTDSLQQVRRILSRLGTQKDVQPETKESTEGNG